MTTAVALRVPTMDLDALAQRLRESRVRARFDSVRLAAKAAGVSKSGLEKYESAQREPKAGFLAKLCKAYGTSADYLLGLTPDPTGLPVGKFIVRDTVVRAVIAAETAEELFELMEDDPKLIDWWYQIQAGSRVTTPEEWATLRDEARRRLAPLLPKLRKRWESRKKK